MHEEDRISRNLLRTLPTTETPLLIPPPLHTQIYRESQLYLEASAYHAGTLPINSLHGTVNSWADAEAGLVSTRMPVAEETGPIEGQ